MLKLQHRASADDVITHAVHNIEKSICNHTLCTEYGVHDINKILSMVQLDIEQATALFADGKAKFNSMQAFRIFQHMKINVSDNDKQILDFLKVLYKSLKSPVLKSLYNVIKRLSNSYKSKCIEVDELKSLIKRITDENNLEVNYLEELEKARETTQNLTENQKDKKTSPESAHIQALKACHAVDDDFQNIYDILKLCSIENDKEAIKFAVDNNLHEVKNKGHNVILFAASENNFELAKAVHECGGDPTSKSTSGASILHYFARDGNVPALEYFASLDGLDINCCNFSDNTPLHFAAWNNKLEAVKYICSLPNINIDAINKERKTAFKYTRSDDIKLFLRSLGCNEKLC